MLLTRLTAAADTFRANKRQHGPLLALTQSINQANKSIYEAGRVDPRYRGMGTTMAAAMFHDNRVVLGHVGDSRIYRMRNGRLELLTRDDSLLRDQVELGVIAAAEARQSHNRSLVTRALGIEERVSAHLADESAVTGDIYLLCSDGLNDCVEDADIELIVSALAANLPLAATHLVQAAKDNGGYDNVSVILAKVKEPFPARASTWWWRFLDWLKHLFAGK